MNWRLQEIYELRSPKNLLILDNPILKLIDLDLLLPLPIEILLQKPLQLNNFIQLIIFPVAQLLHACIWVGKFEPFIIYYFPLKGFLARFAGLG